MKLLQLIQHLREVKFWLPIPLIVICGCMPDADQKSGNGEVLAPISAHGDVENTSGKYQFSLRYKSASDMASQELKNRPFTADLYNKAKDSFQGMYYFTLGIRRNDCQDDIVKCFGNSEEEHLKIITYLSFEMQADCKLITESDTLPCLLYHYERNFGVSPFTYISLGFERPKNDSEKILTFYYRDQFFGSGDQFFDIRESVNE